MKAQLLVIAACAIAVAVSTRTEPSPPESPDSPLDQAELCTLCLSSWEHAIGVYTSVQRGDQFSRQRTRGQRQRRTGDDNQRQEVRIGDGVITAEKVCRSVCTPAALQELERKSNKEREQFTCNACREAVGFLRQHAAPRTLYARGRQVMCSRFHQREVRDDCGHTVMLYADSIDNAIDDGLSERGVCKLYNMCGDKIDYRQQQDEPFEMDETENEQEPLLRAEDIEDLKQIGFSFEGDQ